MDVRKGAGEAERYQAGEDDLACINRLAKRELTADEVYTFAVRLCDNEVDRDFERFDEAALSALGDLFVGKSGIFDHQWSALGQTARIYRTELVRQPERLTAAGDGYCYLKAWAYLMRTEKNADLKKEERSQIVDLGSDMTRSEKGNIYTLTIIGQIEGHQVAPETVKTTKYEHVLPLLAGIEESDDVDGLLLLLNTVGGDIEAGLAIAEMIAGMKKPTVSLVLGGGHSIGIPLAVCTKRSFITPTASMTVHPVRMTGLVVGAPQTFRYFQRIQEQIAEFVTANSRISKKDFEKFMMATGEMATDVGTILYGKEAVASGLIDRLGGLNDALSCLHRMIEKRKAEKKA